MLQQHHYTAAAMLLTVALLATIAALEFREMYVPDKLYPSESLTKKGKLSDYFSGIKNTAGDVDVYYYESGVPGSTALLLGGTHPNESSGFITATVLVENALVKKGRLIVVPQACGSGFTSTDPLEGYPQHFSIKTSSGKRTFRYGARGGNPLDDWPEPLIYRHYPSGQQLSNKESRNLNRAYPGRSNGSFTEQVGYAFMQLIKKEHVDIAFDLHEAAPEIPIINAIVAHEKGKDIAATAVLNLEFENLQYSLEISPKNFHGLSHREWGDSTTAFPFLMETSNPMQGRLRGVTSEELIVDGVDKFYAEAVQLGNVRITYNLEGESLSRRVARHLQGFRRLIEAYNEQFPDKEVLIDNIPDYQSVITGDVGKFLK
jgi:hypothetical protein